MKKIIPTKLKKGDTIRIIAPSISLATVPKEVQKRAFDKLSALGLRVTFGKFANELDTFGSSSINSRVRDFNSAYADKEVKAIIPARGGYNCNELLNYIDWDIIKNNPKIFCGFSDITVLCNAIFAKTGLVTYLVQNYSSFGQKNYYQYTLDFFVDCLFFSQSLTVIPSKAWRDDEWTKDNREKKLMQNEGYLTINEGRAAGTILAGNLCSFNLLQGTKYFPSLEGSILFLEEDELAQEDTIGEFCRNLESIIQQPYSSKIKGIVIGRFQIASRVTNEKIISLIKSKKEISNIPIIANVDFGHTNPRITFPIGGNAKIFASRNNTEIILSNIS